MVGMIRIRMIPSLSEAHTQVVGYVVIAGKTSRKPARWFILRENAAIKHNTVIPVLCIRVEHHGVECGWCWVTDVCVEGVWTCVETWAGEDAGGGGGGAETEVRDGREG